MAGSGAGFSSAAFRNAIHFAMTMGTPSSSDHAVLFGWSSRRSYQSGHDGGGQPFNWSATPSVSVAVHTLQIPCAVEFSDVPTAYTDMGRFHEAKLVVTLLDVDYPKIFDVDGVKADFLVVDGDHYEISYEAPPEALFDVTVHRLFCKARSES